MKNEDTIKNKIQEVHNTLSEWDNEDETLGRLERAMEYFCSNWDKAEGYKCAILETLHDQEDNHFTEIEEQDLNKLLDILNGAI